MQLSNENYNAYRMTWQRTQWCTFIPFELESIYLAQWPMTGMF